MLKLFERFPDVSLAPRTAEEREQSITLLFLAASPLFLWFFRGGFDNMLLGFAFLGIHAFAFWLLSEGLRAEQAYNAAKIATRPRHPRKLYGAAMLGTAVAVLATYQIGLSPIAPMCGLLASILTIATFGIDPLRDKGLDTPEAVRCHRRKVLSQNIRSVLEQLLTDISTLGDADIVRHMREFREMAVRMLIAFENDPESMRDLRKYLRRYLEEAANEVAEFVPSYSRAPDPEARRHFIARLAELRADCEMTLQQFAEAPESDVDVTIEKLMARMAREAAA